MGEMGELWNLLGQICVVPHIEDGKDAIRWMIFKSGQLDTKHFYEALKDPDRLLFPWKGVRPWRPLLRSLSFSGVHSIGKVLTTDNLVWRWQIHLGWCGTWWRNCGSSSNHRDSWGGVRLIVQGSMISLKAIIVNQVLQSRELKLLFIEISRQPTI